MVQKLDDIEMLTFFRLLAFTGMRKNEVGALRWVIQIQKVDNSKVNQKHWPRGENNKILFQTPKKTKKAKANNIAGSKAVKPQKDQLQIQYKRTII